MTPATVLLWDIDGTLLTTKRAGVFALEEAARDVCGVSPDFATLKTAGLTDHEVAMVALEAAGVEATPELASRFLRSYESYLPDRLGLRDGGALPGVTEILEHLKDRPDVLSLLLTGNTSAGAAAKLSHFGLSAYFTEGAFCMDGENRAQIARRARALAADLASEPIDPDRLYVIGDTPHDIRCGKEIGARTVAVASGAYDLPALEAEHPWLALERLPPAEEFAARLLDGIADR